ncbi:tetratricopeptide repeat protein [Vibrio splendidus]|nr:hypothetical protein [Vibrio splendidus]MCC4883141.1 hypothetical protein [Vibrio splendidus]
MKNKFILGALVLAMTPTLVLANVDFEAQPSISDKMIKFEHRNDKDSKLDGINDSISKAGGLKRLQKDADNGDAESKFTLYNMYKYGIVYAVDKQKAHDLLLDCVEANHSKAKLEYAYFLMGYNQVDKTTDGLADPNGNLTEIKKAEIALSLLMDAAYLGDPVAQYVVGSHYVLGKGLPRDRDLGMFFLSKSQTQGFAPAEEARINIDKSLSGKFDIYQIEKDVKLGDLDAMVKLASVYLGDYEIERNKDKAYRLLITAERLGSHNAKQMLHEHF